MNEIICGDCLDILKSMLDKSVDKKFKRRPKVEVYVAGHKCYRSGKRKVKK